MVTFTWSHETLISVLAFALSLLLLWSRSNFWNRLLQCRISVEKLSMSRLHTPRKKSSKNYKPKMSLLTLLVALAPAVSLNLYLPLKNSRISSIFMGKSFQYCHLKTALDNARNVCVSAIPNAFADQTDAVMSVDQLILLMTLLSARLLSTASSAAGSPIDWPLESVTVLPGPARFILVLEKNTVFRRLLNAGFISPNNPGIIISGSGYPDVATRRFLHIISSALAIPAYIVVDCDQNGLEIYLTYAIGSANLAYLNDHLAVPGSKRIGIKPSDVKEFAIEPVQPLAVEDDQRLASMMARPWMPAMPMFMEEIKAMRTTGVSASIDCVKNLPAYIAAKLQDLGLED